LIEAWCDLVCRWKPLFWAEYYGAAKAMLDEDAFARASATVSAACLETRRETLSWQRCLRTPANGSGGFLPPSPPAEKKTSARQDQAGQTSDGAR
jgi:hypothetical protein